VIFITLISVVFSLTGWYSETLPELNAWLTNEVLRLAMPNLRLVPSIDVTPEMLEKDGVHLTPLAGDLFLRQLGLNITSALSSLADVTLMEQSSSHDLSSSDDDVQSVVEADDDRLGAILKIVTSNSQKLSSVKPLQKTIARLEESSRAFESQVRLRRQRDNLVFARIKEESDAELNRSRENRVVISGLDRASDGPSTHQAKKDHYTKLVNELITKACPDLDPKPAVVDIIVSIRRDQVQPSVEAVLDSVSGAFAFRKAASTLAKALNPDFAQLFFSNSISQATRVRIEIMKAIAKKLTTKTENAYVQGFMSRPMLRYLSRDPAVSLCAGTGRNYSFVDSVSRFGDLVLVHDLTAAYKRAGSTFQGAMEQYFVVLAEAGDAPVASGSNRSPIGSRGGRGARAGFRGVRGRKRSGETPTGTPSKKKFSA